MEIFLSSTVTAPVPSRAARWFALIKEAILGSKQDFTAISIDRAIVLLAVPMVLEMAMESLFGIVDIFFVAHLGADSTATVGITEGILVLVMAVAFGLSMGTTAVVARRVGEHDQNGAAEAAVQSILIGLGFAILIFAIAFPFAPELLRWMGAGPGILRVGSLYTRIMLSSSGIILLLFLINAVFRGAGDAAIAMRVLWLANFINLFLDPCLIRGLGTISQARRYRGRGFHQHWTKYWHRVSALHAQQGQRAPQHSEKTHPHEAEADVEHL